MDVHDDETDDQDERRIEPRPSDVSTPKPALSGYALGVIDGAWNLTIELQTDLWQDVVHRFTSANGTLRRLPAGTTLHISIVSTPLIGHLL
jgi:hypothetical protein